MHVYQPGWDYDLKTSLCCEATKKQLPSIASKKFQRWYWIQRYLMGSVHRGIVAPDLHSWVAHLLNAANFQMSQILAPVKWSRLGVAVGTWHPADVHLGVCVEELLYHRMEVQTKKIKEIASSLVWLQRKIFVPEYSDKNKCFISFDSLNFEFWQQCAIWRLYAGCR